MAASLRDDARAIRNRHPLDPTFPDLRGALAWLGLTVVFRLLPFLHVLLLLDVFLFHLLCLLLVTLFYLLISRFVRMLPCHLLMFLVQLLLEFLVFLVLFRNQLVLLLLVLLIQFLVASVWRCRTLMGWEVGRVHCISRMRVIGLPAVFRSTMIGRRVIRRPGFPRRRNPVFVELARL